MNTFARAGHAPHAVMRVDKKLTSMLPKGVLGYAMQIPALKGVRKSVLADLGIPDEILDDVAFDREVRLRATPSARWPARASSCPPLDSYADKLWDYWERNLDPDLFKDRSFEGAVNGRTVVITGASSGIGRAAALKIAAAGGIPILVARSLDKLEEVKEEIEGTGGTRLRVLRRPLRQRLDRRRRSSGSSPSTPRSTCSSTTRAARSAAR